MSLSFLSQGHDHLVLQEQSDHGSDDFSDRIVEDVSNGTLSGSELSVVQRPDGDIVLTPTQLISPEDSLKILSGISTQVYARLARLISNLSATSSERVWKIPLRSRLNYDVMAHYRDVCLHYLAKWVPPMEVFPQDDGSYFLQQKFVPDAHHLTPEHLEDESTYSSFEELMEAAREMFIEKKMFPDPFGFDGGTKTFLSMIRSKDVKALTAFFRWLPTFLYRHRDDLFQWMHIPEGALDDWCRSDVHPELANILVDTFSKLHFVDPIPIDLRLVRNFLYSLKNHGQLLFTRHFLQRDFGVAL